MQPQNNPHNPSKSLRELGLIGIDIYFSWPKSIGIELAEIDLCRPRMTTPPSRRSARRLPALSRRRATLRCSTPITRSMRRGKNFVTPKRAGSPRAAPTRVFQPRPTLTLLVRTARLMIGVRLRNFFVLRWQSRSPPASSSKVQKWHQILLQTIKTISPQTPARGQVYFTETTLDNAYLNDGARPNVYRDLQRRNGYFAEARSSQGWYPNQQNSRPDLGSGRSFT
jgi:hypothetical protein